MAKIKHCGLCQRDVQAVKKFNWIIFLLMCLTGIGGIFYILYYWLIKSENTCPICANTKLTKAKTVKSNLDKVKDIFTK